MKVFFDNCTSPVLASTLNGYLCHYDHEALHIKDVQGLPAGRHSTDEDWIKFLSASPEAWIFISADRRILKNRGERAALRSAGLHGFILAKGFQKQTSAKNAGSLVQRWPDIENLVSLMSPPVIFEIPVSGKIKSLPF
ncbi:PIN-like domain-containing protein [Pseudooceanicola algae]|uniref:VapC45 PIN like domain-containing protein n=1 Tax=Pseudooceanicola algae TaxID=1537215 RepID=A0A418SK91_9RHOB|nr:hypothetical protein [Pseudooceanicola algae]QPM89125.1 hypothetical protein PSAL_003360 [Pseudooceanicola algae]